MLFKYDDFCYTNCFFICLAMDVVMYGRGMLDTVMLLFIHFSKEQDICLCKSCQIVYLIMQGWN